MVNPLCRPEKLISERILQELLTKIFRRGLYANPNRAWCGDGPSTWELTIRLQRSVDRIHWLISKICTYNESLLINYQLTLWRPLCHTGTAIKHHVPDRVKPSCAIFNIRVLWRSGYSYKAICTRNSARVLKVTNDGSTRSGTGC